MALKDRVSMLTPMRTQELVELILGVDWPVESEIFVFAYGEFIEYLISAQQAGYLMAVLQMLVSHLLKRKYT